MNNNKLFIDVETNLDEVIEQAEALLAIVDDLAEIEGAIEKEKTVFECDIQGMKFKGTKSDFKVFIEGIIFMSKAIGLK